MTFHFKENVFSINVYFQYFNKFFSPPSPPIILQGGGGWKASKQCIPQLVQFPSDFTTAMCLRFALIQSRN